MVIPETRIDKDKQNKTNKQTNKQKTKNKKTKTKKQRKKKIKTYIYTLLRTTRLCAYPEDRVHNGL